MTPAIPTSSGRISEREVVRGGLIIAAFILAGQLLGFVRQAAIAYVLGTGPRADALAVAFAPVDLWWSLLATAVVFGYGPRMALRDREPAFSDFARPVVVASLAVSAVLLLFTRPMVHLLAPGLPAATVELAAGLLRITACAVPAVSTSILFTALLYSERRFAFAASHQGMVNVVTITGGLALARLGPVGFAVGFSAGAWFQLAAACWIARPLIEQQRGHRSLPLRELLREPCQVMAYSLLVGLIPMITRALASTFGPGATSAFDYCLKLLGVPLALLVNPLSSSLLSEIAPFRLRGDPRAALGTVRKAASAAALASALLAGVMMALAPRIVSLLFQRGEFSAASTATVTMILRGFYPALIAWSALDVISRSKFALGRPLVPLLAGALAAGVTLLLSVSGLVTSLGWIGVPAVLGFGTAVLIAARSLWTVEPGRKPA